MMNINYLYTIKINKIFTRILFNYFKYDDKSYSDGIIEFASL